MEWNQNSCKESQYIGFYGHFFEKTAMTIFFGILAIFGQNFFLSLGNPRASALEYFIIGLKPHHRYYLSSEKGFATTKTSKLDIFDLIDAPLGFLIKVRKRSKKNNTFF